MPSHMRSRSLIAIGSLLALTVCGQAQDQRLVPPGWSVGHVRVVRSGTHPAKPDARVAAAADGRALTVRRHFEVAPTDEDDPLFDGATHYNNIRLFDPFPSVDSGTQLPYGLDGIGGFGSDLGFSAAADARVYDRGQ